MKGTLREKLQADMAALLDPQGGGGSTLLETAARNEVAPFFDRRTHHLSAALNTVNAAATMDILAHLEEEGIEAIPLKGPFASELFFDDIGLYTASDIDILVRPVDLGPARALLVGKGYAPEDDIEREMLASHYHIGLQRGRHRVELHWNLAKVYFNVPPEFWWDGVYLEETEEGRFLSLSPENYLLYAIFRLYSHGFYPLKFFLLPAGIIEKHADTMDWEAFLHAAERYRMSRLAFFSLHFLRDVLGAAVPEGILGKKPFFHQFLRKIVESGFAAAKRRRYLRQVLFLSLLDSPGDAARVSLARVFPKRAELKIRYGIGEGRGRLCIWYGLNLILLPWHIATRKSGGGSDSPPAGALLPETRRKGII